MPLHERSTRLRDVILIPSGGWLGEGVVLLSDLLGLWDIFLLMVFFVVIWVIMRTASGEISLALGFIFDLGIPLQYQNDEETKVWHEKHLSGYWPIFVMGTVVEGAGFLFFNPDLFTLVVCLKTTLCLSLWLMRDASGNKITFGSDSNTTSAPRSTNTSDPPFVQGYQPVDPRFPDADAKLRAAGYDGWTREGMIVHMKAGKESHAAHNLNKEWPKVGDAANKERRRKRYTEIAKNERIKRGIPISNDSTTANTSLQAGSSGIGNNTNGGAVRIVPFDQDQIKQIRYKFLSRKDRREMPSADIARHDAEADQIMRYIQEKLTPDEARRDLAKRGIMVQNLAPFRLAKKMPIGHQQARFNRLIGPFEQNGLGMTIPVADLMMEDMLQRNMIPEADALYSSWKAVAEMPNGRNKLIERDKIAAHYIDHVFDEWRDNRSQRLTMPWDPPQLKVWNEDGR